MSLGFLFFKKDIIYLSKRERAQAGGVAGRERRGLPASKEPNSGLNPRTPGS